jgi:hypothetical protein
MDSQVHVPISKISAQPYLLTTPSFRVGLGRGPNRANEKNIKFKFSDWSIAR